MLNKYLSETIAFQGVAEDANGTGLSNAVGSLVVTDYTGSTVFSGVGTHGTTGTYQHVAPTNGWGTGPVNYQWTFTHSSGTNTVVVDNTILILGTASNPASYVKLGELDDYYPLILDYIDDSSEAHVEGGYKYINRLLETLGYKVPVPVGVDGLYDESLRQMNAYLSIYNILGANEASRVEGNENPWYLEFRNKAMDIYKDIKDGRITFRRDIAPSDTGISAPVHTVGSSLGAFHTNWDLSYGERFSGSDYPRTWVIEILGTGTSGNLAESTFRFSNDDGISWGTSSDLNGTTGTCGYDWHNLGWNVHGRFSLGSSTGSETIVATGEKWTFTTQPIKGQKGGENNARTYW